MDQNAEMTSAVPVPQPRLEHLSYLDGWRGLAIFLVLQGHFLVIPGWHTGRMGVDVFFCLSGLLMSRILFVRRTPLTTFYKRRIARIVPNFLLYVTFAFAASAAFGLGVSAREIVPTLLFVRSYLPADPHIFDSLYPIGHLWSLNVEEHSYVFLSLLTLLPLLRGREGWLLIGLGTASAVLHWAYTLDQDIAPPGTFWVRSEVASTNLLLSAGYCLLRDRVAPHVRPWMPVATLALGTLFYWGAVFDWMITMTVSPFLFAFSVNHLSEAPGWLRTALDFRPLRFLGLTSYSIYLWQQPFYQYKDQLFSQSVLVSAALVAGAIAAGVAVYFAYENRTRSYLNRVW
jgi:peptidoglycan/LPS O-acetylase OafA/YrhL